MYLSNIISLRLILIKMHLSNIIELLSPANCLITFSLNRLCKRFLHVLNVFFLQVPTCTSAGTVPLKLKERIKIFN